GKLPFAATILQSVKESWNEEKPIPEEDYVPKFEPAKLDDPKRGTRDEERSGPFPIGVAIETQPPAEGYVDPTSPAPAKIPSGRPMVRIAAFGHGGLFVGKELSPAQEQLLLSTINWQLHRDELLPRDVPEKDRWQFPRLAMSEQTKKLWHLGAFIGL